METKSSKMIFKRGDTNVHTLSLPAHMHRTGLNVHFMAKADTDDDREDGAAVIHRSFNDTDILKSDEGAVVYSMIFSPDDTKMIPFRGERQLRLKGEIELRYPDGEVVSLPGRNKFIKVVAYPDVRGGNG